MTTLATDSRSAVGCPAFVLHVREGYDDRERHVDSMMADKHIDFEYVLDGDMSDLTPGLLAEYFAGDMARRTPATSCAMKHLIACRHIVERGLDGALVLEDDIILLDRFTDIFRKGMAELAANGEWNSRPVIVNYEDTRLRFVPRSKRVRGRVLYEGDRDRMTGALYVNARAARLILDRARSCKMDCPIDLFHCRLLRQGLLTYLWCQPVIATQGSHTGMFRSGINLTKSTREAISWKLKLYYKRLLYFLR